MIAIVMTPLLFILYFFYRNKFMIIGTILFIVTSGFRFYVGSDYDDYVDIFQKANDDSLTVSVEKSIVVASQWFGMYGFNPQALFLAYTLPTFIFIYFGLREISKDKSFLAYAILLIYIVYFYPSMSLVRQCLAASIVFWGTFRYLLNKRHVAFFATICVGGIFHLSSIFYLLLFVFRKIRFTSTAYILIILLSYVFSVTFLSESINYLAHNLNLNYKTYSFDYMPINSTSYNLVTISLIVVFLYCLNFRNNRTQSFFLNIFLFILLTRIYAISYSPFARVSAGFTIFLPVVSYYLIYKNIGRKAKVLFFLLLFVITTARDIQRLQKDYSYYQYTFNICIYGAPCPVSVFGDLPIELLYIKQEKR